MNTKELAVRIAESLCACPTCGDFIDVWPDADQSEPGHKVVYIARDALFVGACSKGHINEFYAGEAKLEDYTPHDITERTIGRFVPQDECPHKRHLFIQVPHGQQVPGVDGMIVGPETVKFCGDCGMRKIHTGKRPS